MVPSDCTERTSGAALQIVIYREEDGFVAQCLDVDVASEGSTEDEARANLHEALELYFGEPFGTPVRGSVSEARIEQITLTSS